MTSTLTGSAVPADSYDVALYDLDGVVYLAAQPIDGAAGAVAGLRERGVAVAFATNNAARTAADVAAQLVDMGIDARPEDVVTSSMAAAAMIVALPPKHAPRDSAHQYASSPLSD